MDERELQGLYARYAPQLEDFWSRRGTSARFGRTVHLFGRAVSVTANEAGVLAAVAGLPRLYSSAPPRSEAPFSLHLVVQAPRQPIGPAPDDLIQRITYSGSAEWLLLHLGDWGQAHADLARGQGVALLTPALAQRPDLVAGCILHTLLLNFFIAAGYGLLHASCLTRGSAALLLLAPHNSGKSTTALRLTLNGFRLLSDSMVFVPPTSVETQNLASLLLGFPVGVTRLRPDMAAALPQVQPFLTKEAVRDEIKYRLDVGQLGEERVQREAFAAEHITLALLSRGQEGKTVVEAAEADTVWEAVMRNSLYYDTPAVWRRNLNALAPLIQRARAFQVRLGLDENGLLDSIGRIMSV